MEPATYRLFLCNQETGNEGEIDNGMEGQMIHKMRHLTDQGHDVWVRTPGGRKILPTKRPELAHGSS